MTDLFLSQMEINELCHPLTQPAAQIRFLRASGLTVTIKPNGRPAVVRSHAELVLSGIEPMLPASQENRLEAKLSTPRPNVDAFMKLVQGGRGHGAKEKVESPRSA